MSKDRHWLNKVAEIIPLSVLFGVKMAELTGL